MIFFLRIFFATSQFISFEQFFLWALVFRDYLYYPCRSWGRKRMYYVFFNLLII
jgi:hypothetical protein